MRFLCVIIFCTGMVQAQENLYNLAYEKAMEDSVITKDEQSLLDLLSTETDTSLIQNPAPPASEPPLPALTLNQEGRWRLIYSSMALGNGLYGFGLPYMLQVDDPNIYAGFQLLAAAGGFYLSYNLTQGMDLSIGRVRFIEEGAGFGLYSVLFLQAMIGFDNWFKIDPNYRIGLGAMMIMVPQGAYWGNRLYDHWSPSDGQAILINFGSTLATLNGIVLHQLLFRDINADVEKALMNSIRMFALCSYGGGLLGVKYSHKMVAGRSISMGDSYLVQGATVLGFYVALQTIALADINNDKAIMLTGASIINAFAWQGLQFVKNVDFSEGDAAIIGLGTLAANGIWRGLSIMTGAELAPDVARVLDITTSIAGFYTTYRSVKARRLKSGPATGSNGLFGLKIMPTLLGNVERVTPGVSLQLKF